MGAYVNAGGGATGKILAPGTQDQLGTFTGGNTLSLTFASDPPVTQTGTWNVNEGTYHWSGDLDRWTAECFRWDSIDVCNSWHLVRQHRATTSDPWINVANSAVDISYA